MDHKQVLSLGIVSVAALSLGLVSTPVGAAGEGSAGLKQIAKQVTVTSVQDPIPGHEGHQLGLLLPPEDGKIYTGTLTYTASKPVEVVVFHAYRPGKEPDVEHGGLVVGQINGKPYAISLMQFPNAVTATNSATVSFTGSGIALHTLNGAKFTATASIHGMQQSVTP